MNPINAFSLVSCSLTRGLPKLLVVSKVMAEYDRKLLILIVTFWIFVPTLDMVSDMTDCSGGPSQTWSSAEVSGQDKL